MYEEGACMPLGPRLTDDKLIVGKDIVWRKGMTVSDLLHELDEIRPLVGVVVNGTYSSRSHFLKTKIPDGAEVKLIPWQEHMSLRELLKYEKDEAYVCAATINGLLIPEDRFDTSVIPENAEVWLLTVVGGG
jgi:sulfur carrier protein ThiS